MRKLWFIALPVVLLACSRAGGIANPASPLPVVDANHLDPLWSLQIGQTQQPVSDQGWSRSLRPALNGDQLFVAQGDTLLQLSIADERRPVVDWQQTLDSVASGPVLDADHLALVTDNAQLQWRKQVDGELVWSVNLSARADAMPAIGEQFIVSYNQDGMVQAFVKTDGSLAWQYQTKVPDLTLLGTAKPLIVGDQVIISTPAGRVLALTLANGQVAWEYRIAFAQGRNPLDRLVDADASPIQVGDAVLVGAYQGNIALVNLRTGQMQGSLPVDSLVSPLVIGSLIVVVTSDSQVVAFNGQGVEQWRQTALQHRRLTAPQNWSGKLAITDAFGGLALLDPTTGELLQTRQVHGVGYRTDAVVADDRYFIQTASGRLTAFAVR